MRKIAVLIATGCVAHLSAQFSIHVETSPGFNSKEAFLYTLDGSKDILVSKINRNGNTFDFKSTKPYQGMMKMYFPENNATLNFISENRDVNIKFENTNNKISNVQYLDDANKLMNAIQDNQQKIQYILPALYQIKEYYADSSAFGTALNNEIEALSAPAPDTSKFPFINYYQTNNARFLQKDSTQKQPTEQDIQNFLVNSSGFLENSSLMQPILYSFISQAASKSAVNVGTAVDNLLKAVNIETPRGQNILSELIGLFDAYGMDELKTKYLTQAKNLKCTINDRLSSTLESNKNTELGAKFPNYTFKNPVNTSAKSLYDVKAKNKVVIFWSSTCSHCEKELPEILKNYSALKSAGAEVIGFSLDSEKEAYVNKTQSLPWINTSELRGWYSSFNELYNVHATPTYFILDSDNKIVAKPDHAADVAKFFNLSY